MIRYFILQTYVIGNVKLIQCLLKSNAFDPYELLEYGMGNILTLYALKRFENVLSIDQCKEVLTVLFDMNVNVLNRVNPAQNAIVFVEDEDNFFAQFVSDDTKKSGKEKGKPKPKKVEKVSKTASMKEFMKSLARKILIKQIQMHVTEMLYIFLEEGNSFDLFFSIYYYNINFNYYFKHLNQFCLDWFQMCLNLQK